MLPALPSQPCTCSGAPLVGLYVALQDLLGDFNGPVPPRAHPCTLQGDRRETRGDQRVAFLFPGSISAFSLQQREKGFRRRGELKSLSFVPAVVRANFEAA